MNNFTETKQKFDLAYSTHSHFTAIVPVHLTINKECAIKNAVGAANEEYYKWQFIYSLIYSGLYHKDYIGVEVFFPKGNKSSAPIKFDAAIFDSEEWFSHYQLWHRERDQRALDWLRAHLIGVIEFKKEDSRNVEAVYNQQLKPALKEAEGDFTLGVIYDAERLYLFQKRDGLFLRLDENFNTKGSKSTTKELSLEFPDGYIKIPSFEQLQKKTANVEIDRSKRTVDDLDVITGVYSKQLNDGISNILRVMDRVGRKDQRGYQMLIQLLALKIYDEKRSINTTPSSNLDFYKSKPEKEQLDLLFYITDKEKGAVDLGDENVQRFIKRFRDLYKEASQTYHYILSRDDNEIIHWKNESDVRVVSEIVEQFQDYSFVKSPKTDLYQIVFYKFASEFSKTEKGQFLTPIPLIDFLVSIVNPRATEKLIDPTAGIADFLSVSYVNSHSKLDDNNIYGMDNDEQMVMLAQLNMLLNGDGNAVLKYQPDKGSITWKFDNRGDLVELDPRYHANGNWDNWPDQTQLKKFDVVLTNPPFGQDRKYEARNSSEREVLEMYELWNIARSGDWIDPGLIFLENAYRILKENGRLGIILSNSIASIERWERAREWLIERMRIVAIFDLPSDVFADTGVNTTLIVAYKPEEAKLDRLKSENYKVFLKNITNVGYEVKTDKRVKFFSNMYKINPLTFEIEQDEEGNPKLDEEFGDTVKEFKEWCLGQEKDLQDLFIKER